MRTKIVMANWKMNFTPSDAARWLSEIKPKLSGDTDVILFASFTSFPSLSGELPSHWRLGAQNFYPAEAGAFTGEVSLEMLKESGVTAVLVGHSERRQLFQESDQFINQKVLAAIEKGFQVVFCVGESLTEKESGARQSRLQQQLELGLDKVTKDQLKEIIIAYEPIWAIGTGRTATTTDAVEAHQEIRAILTRIADAETAELIKIAYGGSVKASNSSNLLACSEIDGLLVGGASLKAEEFSNIIKGANNL